VTLLLTDRGTAVGPTPFRGASALTGLGTVTAVGAGVVAHRSRAVGIKPTGRAGAGVRCAAVTSVEAGLDAERRIAVSTSVAWFTAAQVGSHAHGVETAPVSRVANGFRAVYARPSGGTLTDIRPDASTSILTNLRASS